MAVRRIKINQCDRCGQGQAAEKFELVAGRLSTRRRVQFDACSSCQKKAPLADWLPVSRIVSRRGRSEVVRTPAEVDELARTPRGFSAKLSTEAIASYLAARAETDVTGAVLRDETRVLDRFVAVNGNIFVHDTGRAHVERALVDEGQSLTIDTLENFFAWCRRNRWMRGQTDPLRSLRVIPLPTTSPLDDVEAGRCTRCRKPGFVLPISIKPVGARSMHFLLCRRCRGRAPLSGLTASREPVAPPPAPEP